MLNHRLLFWTVLLFSMWLVLTANFQMANILIGLLVSFSISLLYSKIFKHKTFEHIGLVSFLVYLYVLLKNLIISNIQISKRVLSKDMKIAPAIVAVKTDLDSDWKKLLLANSITLTPGTLTLDVKGDTLYIHSIEHNDSSKKEDITKEFEEVIAKI